MHPDAPPVYLLASVVRNVDGLDINLFEQALQIRRKFIQVLRENMTHVYILRFTLPLFSWHRPLLSRWYSVGVMFTNIKDLYSIAAQNLCFQIFVLYCILMYKEHFIQYLCFLLA